MLLTLEAILDIKQPYVQGGVQKKINAEMNTNPSLVQNIQIWCSKLNTPRDSKVPSNIYHKISTHIHGGKYPIECHTVDRLFSPGEWAFVIAVLVTNLTADAYAVYDSNDSLIK